MKTEIETYLEIIDENCRLNKSDTFLLEINPVKGSLEKSIAFYKVIKYNHPKIKDDLLMHFRFVSKKMDEKAIKNIEQGLINLAEKGYSINYYNTC